MKQLFSAAATFIGAKALSTPEYTHAQLADMEVRELDNQTSVPCQWWFGGAWYDFTKWTTLTPSTYVAQETTSVNTNMYYALCVDLGNTDNGAKNEAAYNPESGIMASVQAPCSGSESGTAGANRCRSTN